MQYFDIISFLAGFFFGALNFYLTIKSSALLLSKKGVANPRAIIVIKLLFLLVGLSVLTAVFQNSLGWVAGGFLLFLFSKVIYFVVIHSRTKK